MPIKNTAKDFELWMSEREYPVDSFDFGIDYNEIDTTDSTTNPDGTEVISGRSKRATSVNAFLYSADGAELSSGSLVAGTKYRVTLGTITEGALSYPIGTIFTSAGTGTATISNKVVPLGTPINGKAVACSIASVVTPVTNFKYAVSYNETDVTDSATAADNTETVVGRAKRTSTIELIQKKDATDLLAASPAPIAVILTLTTGVTITGSATFKKLGGNTASSKSDAVKQQYEMTWQGVPTFAGALLTTLLPVATSVHTSLIYAKGATSNRSYSGNATVTSYDLSTDVNNGAKISYKLTWQGAVTTMIAD